MKQVISENDYERYKIYVPVKLFMGGKQRKYISSQLEKLHPCFSDNFCFDSKYRISNKGLCANVVVMDKLRLSEYKSNYPGVTLTCKDKGEGTVFSDERKRSLITLLCCIPLIVILFLTMRLRYEAKQKNENILQSDMELPAEESIKEEVFVYEQVFNLFDSQNGKIEKLSWKYDGFAEHISVSAVNCYPDVFSYSSMQNVSFSNINYIDDIPSFSLDIINRKTADFSNKAESSGGEDYRSQIRAILKENEIKLVNESYLPYKIRFRIYEKNIEEKVLSLIENVSIRSGLCVKDVDLNVSGDGFLDAEICFSKDFSYSSNSEDIGKTILSCIESEWKIFDIKNTPKVESKSPKKQVQKNIPRVVTVSEKQQRDEGERKIGTIIHADGDEVVFYKTVKGVIKNE